MSRRAAIFAVIGVLAVAGLGFATCYWVGHYCSDRRLSRQADELDWLRHEFKLNETELSRVRKLHEGYLPICRDNCERIAEKKAEFEQAMASGGTNFTPVAEQKLAEVALLRAKCQAAMLRHFYEVSQAMPADQGQRYLAEMRRLTLSAHERLEQSMSVPVRSGHEHHQ